MLSPKLLLSSTAREQCISKFRQLPSLLQGDIKNKAHAAVLVPLCVKNGDVCLLYTLRSSNLKSHSGQISFPGGKMDPNETIVETALRETEEEIGIHPSDVDVWDAMSPFPAKAQDLIITPVVGLIKNFDSIVLKPNVDEVEEVFTVPIRDLCDSTAHAHYAFNKFPLPVFEHDNHKIWGITGIITHYFLQCLIPTEIYSPDFMRKQYNYNDLMPSKL